MPMPEHVVVDYQTTGLSLKAHPLSFMRGAYQMRGILANKDLVKCSNNDRVAVAGVVLVRQRPGTAKGVVFITIEDETGIANCVVWAKVMERYRRVLMGARLVLIEGRLQKHGSIIHVVVEHMADWTHHLVALSDTDRLAEKSSSCPRRRGRPSDHRSKPLAPAAASPSTQCAHHAKVTGFSLRPLSKKNSDDDGLSDFRYGGLDISLFDTAFQALR